MNVHTAVIPMTQPKRAYTIDEIDQMRDDVYHLLFHDDPLCHMFSQQDNRSGVKEEVEIRLRTYLIAGIDPADIHAKREFLEHY